jgi:hypothetical protein
MSEGMRLRSFSMNRTEYLFVERVKRKIKDGVWGKMTRGSFELKKLK